LCDFVEYKKIIGFQWKTIGTSQFRKMRSLCKRGFLHLSAGQFDLRQFVYLIIFLCKYI